MGWIGSHPSPPWCTAAYSSGLSLLTRRPTGLGLAVTLLGTPMFIYACWTFFSAPFSLAWASLLLGMMAGVRQLERRVWHDDIVVKLGKYVPAAAALLGHSLARGALLLLDRAPAEAEAAGWEAACGVLGGAFFLAGLAKLRESGFDWVPARHEALLIAERAYSGAPALRWLRRRVAATPWLCLAAGLYGFYGEFLGLLFALRACVAARPAPEGAAPGPLRVELGLIILQHVNGERQVRERIDAVGAAEARP